ncbi:MAG: class I SAM-dependent methyltransferase [Burkholderiaceae bacterium]
MSIDPEAQAVAQRYARRTETGLYSMLRPEVWQTQQERQRAMLKLFAGMGWRELGSLHLLEVGCGSGANLLELLHLGFTPQHLAGVELLADRFAMAGARLPSAVSLWAGDATRLELPSACKDVVLVSTVFSSLLDDAYQQRLADAMWHWVKPGGGVLWYDFTVDNPANPDVRGVALRRVRELFPQGQVQARRITLAPPIARRVVRLHPCLYTVFNTLPWLRTHLLAWIAKARG